MMMKHADGTFKEFAPGQPGALPELRVGNLRRTVSQSIFRFQNKTAASADAGKSFVKMTLINYALAIIGSDNHRREASWKKLRLKSGWAFR
jgi:hypothetical protein